MVQFDLYRGRLLFLSTTDIEEAFRMFKKWTGMGLNVKMKFITVKEKAAA
jgi:hypothetical protein